jgi:hypothetical protein
LDLYDLGADPELPTRSAPQLVAAAEQLCQQVRATKLYDAAVNLPEVMAEIATAVYRAPSTELWAALSNTYRTAHDPVHQRTKEMASQVRTIHPEQACPVGMQAQALWHGWQDRVTLRPELQAGRSLRSLRLVSRSPGVGDGRLRS